MSIWDIESKIKDCIIILRYHCIDIVEDDGKLLNCRLNEGQAKSVEEYKVKLKEMLEDISLCSDISSNLGNIMDDVRITKKYTTDKNKFSKSSYNVYAVNILCSDLETAQSLLDIIVKSLNVKRFYYNNKPVTKEDIDFKGNFLCNCNKRLLKSKIGVILRSWYIEKVNN